LFVSPFSGRWETTLDDNTRYVRRIRPVHGKLPAVFSGNRGRFDSCAFSTVGEAFESGDDGLANPGQAAQKPGTKEKYAILPGEVLPRPPQTPQKGRKSPAQKKKAPPPR